MKRLSLAAIPAALFLFATAALGWTPITGTGQCDNSPGRGHQYVYIVNGPDGDSFDIALPTIGSPTVPHWFATGTFGPDNDAGITTNTATYDGWRIWVRYTLDKSVVTEIEASPLCDSAPSASPITASPSQHQPSPTQFFPSPTIVHGTTRPTAPGQIVPPVDVTPPATDAAGPIRDDTGLWPYTLILLGMVASVTGGIVRLVWRRGR